MTEPNKNDDFAKAAVAGFTDFLSKNALTRLDKVEKDIVILTKTLENLMAGMESTQATVELLVRNLIKKEDN